MMSVRSKAKAIAALSVLGAAMLSAAARAEDWHAREVQLLGLHDLCNKGDRRACVQFGMMLGEAKERHADWRRAHPDWWWWEH
ncbi:hypothetical protein [Hyphomicrobium sp.]|uniref:hypothetical protein n=1 Tax=Hyphomicrobium sp. TaxID=82 RepID=UPI000F926E10|nr:hypothetical protein [Hyphomicrobium sp.]RUP08032.1 MAG: hypothetical protein EKK38_15890 [Hyphomicrobium sp.]